MKRLLILICLILLACGQAEAPVQEAESSVPPPEVEIKEEVKEEIKPEPVEIIEEEEEEELKDYGECWKDSDCGQDCKDMFTMNVYKCDLKQHKCMPEKYETYDTVDCKEKYGYQYRCRVGRCMKGS